MEVMAFDLNLEGRIRMRLIEKRVRRAFQTGGTGANTEERNHTRYVKNSQ